MNRLSHWIPVLAACGAAAASAEVKVTFERAPETAGGGFTFANIPPPRVSDAAAKAPVIVVDGRPDGNSAASSVLVDGAVPAGADEPARNFFFASGTDGGRLVVDLGRTIEVGAIRTYSRHTGERGPQVYRVFGLDAETLPESTRLKRPADPEAAGFKPVASVDTRAGDAAPGGTHAVAITSGEGALGRFRFLLFDVSRTAETPLGNTFFSEIDVIEAGAPDADDRPPAPEKRSLSVNLADGRYRLTIETTDAPDLTDWARDELVPVVQEWYPKIVDILPGKDFEAPRTVLIEFTNSYRGVAATAGNRIMCNPDWYRRELKREAKGSIVHELVHVVQQYRGRRGARPPGWLVEGIPDYIRWFLYEPESRGAEIRPEGAARARYDAGYRTSANFLNYVVGKYDKNLIPDLNAILREGKYDVSIWESRTGHSLEALAAEWKKALEEGKG